MTEAQDAARFLHEQWRLNHEVVVDVFAAVSSFGADVLVHEHDVLERIRAARRSPDAAEIDAEYIEILLDAAAQAGLIAALPRAGGCRARYSLDGAAAFQIAVLSANGWLERRLCAWVDDEPASSGTRTATDIDALLERDRVREHGIRDSLVKATTLLERLAPRSGDTEIVVQTS